MRTTMIALTAIAAMTLGGGSAFAGQAKQTAAGGFDTLPAGEATDYENAHGSARIVRDLREGTTTVHVVLNNLAPDTSYGSHLHLGTCDTVGGHYKHDPAGTATPPNELWPAFTTDEQGRARTSATADWVARDEAASVVVHDPATRAMVLCASL